MSKQITDVRSFVADLIEGRMLYLANQDPNLARLLGASDLVRQTRPSALQCSLLTDAELDTEQRGLK